VAEQIQKCAELEKPAILMLSSSTAPGDAGRSRELGVAALLTKPIRRKDLLEALLQVISGALVQRVTGRLPDSLSASGAERKLRILLAEDNAVNQTVAMRMLQKHRHEVVVAGNGKEVLELLRDPKRHFDLILMDIQMPEMDGFAATAAIRDSEKGTGRHIPIVAMTAHAMKGDRERCLAAGMDSYISKPIRTTELSRLLDGFTGRGGILAPPSETPPIGAEIPDMKIALENFDHDEGLLAEVIGLYLRDSPAMLAALRVSIERQEPNEVERAAHRFKGAISNFAAPEVNRVAQQLEMMGQQGDLSGTREALSRLESLLPPVHELMTRFREEQVRHANTDSGR